MNRSVLVPREYDGFAETWIVGCAEEALEQWQQCLFGAFVNMHEYQDCSRQSEVHAVMECNNRTADPVTGRHGISLGGPLSEEERLGTEIWGDADCIGAEIRAGGLCGAKPKIANGSLQYLELGDGLTYSTVGPTVKVDVSCVLADGTTVTTSFSDDLSCAE